MDGAVLRVVVLAVAAGCTAVPSSGAAARRDHGLEVTVENDSVGLGDTTDEGYTNGLRLDWRLSSAATPTFLDAFGRSAWFGPSRLDGVAAGFAIGQETYTPADISRRDPIPDDRPYAGWAYFATVVQTLRLGGERRDDRLDTWELDLGVVGPSSAAETTQIEWHEWIASPRPNGWQHQIHDEFGLVLHHDRRTRPVWEPGWLFGLDADAIARFGFDLGNVHTRGSLGATVRLGTDLDRDLGSRIVARDAEAAQGLRWHVLAGVQGHVVARNIFLDGNTFRSSPSVDSNPFVADFTVGLEVAWSDAARLSYVHVFRTPEFDSATAKASPQDFARVVFSLDF